MAGSVVRTASWNDDGSSNPWVQSFDGTGGNCLCVVLQMIRSWGGSVSGITFNGVAMTPIVNDVQISEMRRIVYYLRAPASGSQDISVTLTNVGFYPAMGMAAILMNGIDQITTVRALVSGTNVSASNLQLTDATSASGDVSIGLFMSEYRGGPPTDGAGWSPEAGTTEFCDHYRVGVNGTAYTGCCYRLGSGPNMTVNMTADGNNNFGATMQSFIVASTGNNPGSPLYYRRRRRMAS